MSVFISIPMTLTLVIFIETSVACLLSSPGLQVRKSNSQEETEETAKLICKALEEEMKVGGWKVHIPTTPKINRSAQKICPSVEICSGRERSSFATKFACLDFQESW